MPCPSVLDPTMRVGGPDGDHVLSLEVLGTPYALDGGWDGSAEPERWLERLGALVGRDRELTHYETAMEGLFLTGAATFPGAGVRGASGRNAAAVVLRHRDVQDKDG